VELWANDILVQLRTHISTGHGLSVIQFRGGLVPVQQDGTTVVDKPAAFNFIGAEVVNQGGVADVSLPTAVTATGDFIEALFVQPASTFSLPISAASYADLVDTNSVRAEGTFTASVSGKYKFTVRGTVYLPNSGSNAISSFRIRPVFDQGGYGGFTEQIINPPSVGAWQ
jgi:hypothetical protein